jgi:hypothetical protein
MRIASWSADYSAWSSELSGCAVCAMYAMCAAKQRIDSFHADGLPGAADA